MIGSTFRAAVTVGVALAATLPAAAQFDAKPDSMVEAVKDGVFGFCPLFVAGQLPLRNNAQLTMRGYSAQPQAGPAGKFGPTEFVAADFKDGSVRFGGVAAKVCSVDFQGAARDAAAQAIRGGLGNFASFNLKPDPANSSETPGAKIEAFAGKVDATTFLHLFIVTMGAQSSVAIYVSDK